MGQCKMQVRMCAGLAAAGVTEGGGLQEDAGRQGGGRQGGGLQGGGLQGGGLGADQEAELGEIEAASARHEASLAQPTPGLGWLDRPTYTYLETRWQALDSQLLTLPLTLTFHPNTSTLTLPRRSTHSWL